VLIVGISNETWKILCFRQSVLCEGKSSQEFVKGLKAIGFDPQKIPNFEEISKKLTTGWKVSAVPGLIPVKEFFEMIARREFPTTTWIRSSDSLDYIQEPDLFHDVFGHVPMLTNQLFCNFMAEIGKIALKWIDNPQAIEILSRLWWFTVEFGLIREDGQLKAFGGGILSSRAEVLHSVSDKPTHRPFEVQEIFRTPFQIDRIQDQYFVIESFDQLFDCLKEVETLLEMELACVIKNTASTIVNG